MTTKCLEPFVGLADFLEKRCAYMYKYPVKMAFPSPYYINFKY